MSEKTTPLSVATGKTEHEAKSATNVVPTIDQKSHNGMPAQTEEVEPVLNVDGVSEPRIVIESENAHGDVNLRDKMAEPKD